MRRPWLVLTLAATLLLPLGSIPAATAGGEHCHDLATLTAIEGGMKIEKKTGVQTIAWAPPAPAATITGTQVVIRARAFTWDADGNDATLMDTITVTPGTQVRWQWIEGTHTITDGKDSGDCCHLFNYLLDAAHPTFDTTLATVGQLDYFCFVHEGIMHGTILVQDPTGVPPSPATGVARFARPPSPNPSRGAFTFAIALPRETEVTLDVHDAAGRSIARLHDGPLAAGDHPFSWNGRQANGQSARNGAYFVRMRAGDITDSRRIVLRR